MITKREVISVLVVTIILAFIIAVFNKTGNFLNNLGYSLLVILIILAVNISAKKFVAYLLDAEIEHRIWEFKRFGFKPQMQLKKAIPAGALFPLLFSFITMGYVKWMACLVFEVKPKTYHAARRHGLYSFSEMTEFHMGLIAVAGIFASIIAAIIAYFFGVSEFAKLSVYYVFFNMFPLGDLDGNKIFFGNIVVWSFLAALVIIAMGYAVFLI